MGKKFLIVLCWLILSWETDQTEEHWLTRGSQSHTWQRGCPTACWAHARQLGHVVDAVMAIINLTMRSPKAAAAGSSDRQRPYVATVSGHQSGPPFPLTSFLLFAGSYAACVFSVLNCVTSHVCFCGRVTLCRHLCDLNTGCAKTHVCSFRIQFQTLMSSLPVAKGKSRKGGVRKGESGVWEAAILFRTADI